MYNCNFHHVICCLHRTRNVKGSDKATMSFSSNEEEESVDIDGDNAQEVEVFDVVDDTDFCEKLIDCVKGFSHL
jgi:hypothetical protein